MKILLFGKTGQLGWEARRALSPLGEVYAYGRDELDLTNHAALAKLIRELKPQVIVNASAYTAVDKAESEPEVARAINAKAPAVMAEEARALAAAFIHVSTDYVFDGNKNAPYVEEDPTNPLNAYGQSKLEGEQAVVQVGGAHVILRASWVYSLRGDNFVTKTLAWSRKQETLKIVSDQVGSPTWARMLAEAISAMLARGGPNPADFFAWRAGVYHLGGSGFTSRLDFAREILRLDPNPEEQALKRLEPALTTDFPTPATRPMRTALNCSKFEQAFGLCLPEWGRALELAMKEF
ncbi:MAG: dTDP-4-dehydrorhamnose reductase [Anaerolineales bacterium]|nr:dTDP-4-dehydrorhamnose reductase [Anaerolineales bacterium]